MTPSVIPEIVWKPNPEAGQLGGEFYVRTPSGWRHYVPNGPAMTGPPAAVLWAPTGWDVRPRFFTKEEFGPEKPQEPAGDPLADIGEHLSEALASGAAGLLHGAEKSLRSAREWLEDL